MTLHPQIHPTAIVHPGASVASSAVIGPYCIIDEHVSVGERTRLKSHVVLTGHTTVGSDNDIYPFVSIGDAPQDLKYADEPTRVEIGNGNRIRESCTIHRGTIQDRGVTCLGNDNLLMVNTHIAHDCVIGDQNIIGNNAGIAGHVVVGDRVLIGGNSGIHQFCQVGSHAMLAGGTTLYKDVPAYVLVAGNPASASGMNYEGMRRRGWDSSKINLFRQAYQLVYRKGLTLAQAIAQVREELLPQEPDLELFVSTLEQSTRGITR